MKDNIYDLLNDIEVDLSELEKENFTELERKRAMKKFRGSIKRNTGYKKCAGMIGAIVIGVGVLGRIPVFAETNPVINSIAKFLRMEKDLESYTTIVDKSITKGDVTIQLNEVIVDEKELVVSTTITYKEPIELVHMHASASVYVNGKIITRGAGGSSRQIDEYTVAQVRYYDLDEVYTGDMDMTLLFESVRVNDIKQKGQWKFEFSTNGEELAGNTISKEINQMFTLPNETNIMLTRYTSNDMGEKIYFTSSEEGVTYDLELRGTDDMGNPIVFTFSNQNRKEGVLKLNTYFSDKDEAAKSYTLELYAVKFPEGNGQLSNDFEKIGEAVEITLK